MPSLDDVYEAIAADPFWDHLRLPGIKLVPGYGQRTRPKVLLVGEAPGATENARGRPFCGPSGRVLDQLMELADIRLDDKPNSWAEASDGSSGNLHDEDPRDWRANAFITNVVKYRPPGNRTPTHAEIISGTPDIRREWTALGKPRVIICVGSVAHAAIHPCNLESLSNNVGRPIDRRMQDGTTVWFISQYHPAFGLRGGPKRQTVMEAQWEEMGKFLHEEGLL